MQVVVAGLLGLLLMTFLLATTIEKFTKPKADLARYQEFLLSAVSLKGSLVAEGPDARIVHFVMQKGRLAAATQYRARPGSTIIDVIVRNTSQVTVVDLKGNRQSLTYPLPSRDLSFPGLEPLVGEQIKGQVWSDERVKFDGKDADRFALQRSRFNLMTRRTPQNERVAAVYLYYSPSTRLPLGYEIVDTSRHVLELGYYRGLRLNSTFPSDEFTVERMATLLTRTP